MKKLLARAAAPALARRAPFAAAAVAVIASAVSLRPAPARAEDYVTVRGAYYREPSTRVIQPIVEVERDSPSGIDVSAHFLVDAITSASIAAGTATDAIFTEVRTEAGLRVRKRWDRTEATIGYKYSAESDYWSHAFGGSVARRFWGDTARLALSGGASFDRAQARGPVACPAKPADCSLTGIYGGVAYTQVVSPVMIAQASAESAYLDGFQGNLYRVVPMLGVEKLPEKRLRNALSARVAYYVPPAALGFQLHYRYYFDVFPGAPPADSPDPWNIWGHMIEARIYKTLTPDLEVRLSYRQYFQSNAEFWCDTIERPGCYGPGTPLYYSTDVKLGKVHTEFPEAKLLWDANALAGTPFFGWFAAGTFEISYGYYMQSTSYADAHVLQMGYRMPY